MIPYHIINLTGIVLSLDPFKTGFIVVHTLHKPRSRAIQNIVWKYCLILFICDVCLGMSAVY